MRSYHLFECLKLKKNRSVFTGKNFLAVSLSCSFNVRLFFFSGDRAARNLHHVDAHRQENIGFGFVIEKDVIVIIIGRKNQADQRQEHWQHQKRRLREPRAERPTTLEHD